MKGGSTRDPQKLVARPLGRWEDVPGGSRNQKTAGIGGRGTNLKKKLFFFIIFFGGHNERYFMILRFIPTFSGVKNLMVRFISPKNFIFLLLLVLRLVFLGNFFRCQIKRFWEILKFFPKL